MTEKNNEQIAKIITIVRGLLAQPTGDDDIPYRPVIVSFSENPESAVANVLQIDSLEPEQEPEKIREQLKTAIDAYCKKNGSNLDVISIKNIGSVRIIQKPQERKFPLQNKVALVTGAAGAIGYGICKALMENGCYLAATDLEGEKLDSLTNDLKQIANDRVIGVPIDVTDERSVTVGFDEVIRMWGGVDIVVVNAGIPLVCHLTDMDLEAFRKLEKVNVEGAMLTLSEAGRHFIRQGIGGDIIIISTKNVPSPGAGFGAYSATKAACHQLGRIASIELAQYGIRVNMVAPDAVFAEGKYRSGLWEEIGPDRMKARGLDEKQLQEYYQGRNLLKAKVTGRHVANAVLFFATRQTPTTGATIPVDGGLPDATPR
jgi:NAD(P)-dependent dehydrogenase (short-subunit alcohol dehydrogenase family)